MGVPLPKSPALRTALVLAGIFALSMAFRAPFLGRPLGAYYETTTSTVLTTQRIWHEGRIIADRFLPVMSYPLRTDKNINNWASVHNAQGDYYYTSYPSLSYVAPYLLMRALQLAPSPPALRWFNVLCQFFTAVFVFLTVRRLTAHGNDAGPRAPAYVAFIFLVFAPCALWFQSISYMADMFVQLPFAAGVYVFLRGVQAPRVSPRLALVLGLVTYCMVMSEWIGVLFAAAVAGYVVFSHSRRRLLPLLVSAVGGASLALVTVAVHYSSIAGLSAWLRALATKAAVRSGETDKLYSPLDPMTYLRIARNYAFGYTWELIVLAALVVLFVSLRRSRQRQPAPAVASFDRIGVLAVLVVAGIPILIHHALLSAWSAEHDFSVLKTSILIAILAGVLWAQLSVLWRDRPAWRRIAVLAVTLMVVASAAQFVIMAKLSTTSMYRDVGQSIASTSRPDEVVFVEGSVRAAWPQIVYYAGRNLATYTTPGEAVALMQQSGAARGVVFRIDGDPLRVLSVQRISLRDPASN